MKSNCTYLLFITPLSFRAKILRLKSKLGVYHVLLLTPKILPKTLTLTVVKIQQLSDIEKTDSKEETSWLNWTRYIGRIKVYEKFNI